MLNKFDSATRRALLGRVSWHGDQVFAPEDKETLRKEMPDWTETELSVLTSSGLTKSDINDGTDFSMWYALDGVGSEQNYFEDVYKKLSCCLGQSDIFIPYLEKQDDGSYSKKLIQFKASECGDWYDDNTTVGGYNPKCEKFMKRFIGYLMKHHPQSPLIERHGGCLANKFLSKSFMDWNDGSKLYELADVNRSCVVPQCNQNLAYRRQRDRKLCSQSFCQSIIDVKDSDIGRNLNMDATVTQNCGITSTAGQTATTTPFSSLTNTSSGTATGTATGDATGDAGASASAPDASGDSLGTTTGDADASGATGTASGTTVDIENKTTITDTQEEPPEDDSEGGSFSVFGMIMLLIVVSVILGVLYITLGGK